MKILIGTTNESKIKRFKELINKEVEFLTLKDLNIESEPQEKGNTPEENARIKAEFYGKYFDTVVCNDSGLYFNELPITDSRQPGLNIRTPQGKRLDDEEMIKYYSKLIKSLGGKVSAFYLDGFAIYQNGKVFSYMNLGFAKQMDFLMVDSPVKERNIGWPLDSLSINKRTGLYFTDKNNKYYNEDNIITADYMKSLEEFMAQTLDF